MKITFTSLIAVASFNFLLAQESFTISQKIVWEETSAAQPQNRKPNLLPTFKGAVYNHSDAKTLPVFTYRFQTEGGGRIGVEISEAKYTPLSIEPNSDLEKLAVNIQPKAFISQARSQYWGNIQLTPLRRVNGNIEKLVSFKLIVTTVIEPSKIQIESRGTKESILRDGDIYKFAVKETGIHRLDYAFLKNELKINNLDNIDPRTIKLYGNGGGMLPEANAVERPDDLVENNILIVGEEDGKFDAADVLLFYAVGPDKWLFDSQTKIFSRPKNIYDDEAFYFIKINTGNGARLPTQTSLPNGTYTATSFNDFQRYEEDKVNLLAQHPLNCGQGGGKLWFGDFFGDAQKERTYTDKFSFPNLISTEPILVNAQFVAGNSFFSDFELNVGGNALKTTVSSSEPNDCEGRYGHLGSLSENLRLSNATNPLAINVKYESQQSSARAWLDYIEIQCRRQLTLVGTQMAFRDLRSMTATTTNFQLANANGNTQVWDITQPLKPKNQQMNLAGSQANFSANTEGVLRQYIAFDKTATNFPKPTGVIGKVANQNLHAFDQIDQIIVYHKDFEKAAQKLAAHRRKFSNFNVALAEISQVYNEFSSGALDPAAIRDMARMFQKRTPRFKYLLLLGDGSFDYKRLYALGNLQPTDFIPPYEADESFSIVDSYPSDDFYALLSDTEGVGLAGDLDIAVGRIPCKTAAEAEAVVEKILLYESPATLGDWRNKSVFAADDGDGNAHSGDTDDVAEKMRMRYRNLNIEKLYIDAYKLEVSAGGTRAPQLNEAIYQNQFKGMLTFCYLGHGGPKGLAQERILLREDLEAWRNKDRLPLLVTATCSFSGYDNPKEVTAGEAALLNPNGGAIALYSTVRAVYANQNKTLTDAVFDTIYARQNRQAQLIGDIIAEAKNRSGTSANGQKFTLLGDPAVRLALPRFGVATTKINDKTLGGTVLDTVRALQSVTIEGSILDDNGAVMTDFNGTIFPTVYDKAQTLRTLGQSLGGNFNIPMDFNAQRNILFKGAASVKSGRWTFRFTVPKDIDYVFGKGKISYYAQDASRDATGNFEDFIVGGTTPSVSSADNAPKVQVFIGDEKWVSGSITNANPVVYVKLSDDKGFNVSGTSIGHDLTGVLNEARNPFILNNFYEAVKDDPTRGIVRYPLSNLASGKYKIRIKAWDIANNSGEGETEFLVSESGSQGIKNVVSYPNPFSDKVSFRFEHNVNTQSVRVKVAIFNLIGQQVKTIEQTLPTDGIMVSGIEWDGSNILGHKVASGIYLYRITATTLDKKPLTVESGFQKLVFMR